MSGTVVVLERNGIHNDQVPNNQSAIHSTNDFNDAVFSKPCGSHFGDDASSFAVDGGVDGHIEDEELLYSERSGEENDDDYDPNVDSVQISVKKSKYKMVNRVPQRPRTRFKTDRWMAEG